MFRFYWIFFPNVLNKDWNKSNRVEGGDEPKFYCQLKTRRQKQNIYKQIEITGWDRGNWLR